MVSTEPSRSLHCPFRSQDNGQFSFCDEYNREYNLIYPQPRIPLWAPVSQSWTRPPPLKILGRYETRFVQKRRVSSTRTGRPRRSTCMTLWGIRFFYSLVLHVVSAGSIFGHEVSKSSVARDIRIQWPSDHPFLPPMNQLPLDAAVPGSKRGHRGYSPANALDKRQDVSFCNTTGLYLSPCSLGRALACPPTRLA